MGTKRHKPKHIYDELFQVNYYISYGVEGKDFVKAVQRFTGVYILVENLKDGKCLLIENKKSKNFIVWIWTKKRRIPELAHECVHAADYALSELMPNAISTETFAYTVQMLIRKALEK